MKKTNHSTYIHIPFCTHICYYCDFNKVLIEKQPVDEYIENLLKEIDLTQVKFGKIVSPTLYIGGGTPTALDVRQMERLLSGIRERIELPEDAEFTMEANPGDVSAEKLDCMVSHGVNRVSLGIQSFDDALLRKIGRKHSAREAKETVHLLQSKFQNVSMDLIYALPGQTLRNFEETLDEALALELPHSSLYSLILENKTQFMNWVRKGRLSLPDEDAQASMFELAKEKMENKGMRQYEISNFAKPGFESKHNLVYWNNENYFAFGAGASGYLNGERFKNFGPIQHYLKPLRTGKLPIYQTEQLSKSEQMEEEMFLGLRKMEGVSILRFSEKFQVSFDSVYGNVLEKFIKQNLLEQENGYVRLTEKGILLGNNVFEGFLLSEA